MGETDGRITVLGLSDDRHVRLVSQRHTHPITGGPIAIGYDYSHHVHVHRPATRKNRSARPYCQCGLYLGSIVRLGSMSRVSRFSTAFSRPFLQRSPDAWVLGRV